MHHDPTPIFTATNRAAEEHHNAAARQDLQRGPHGTPHTKVLIIDPDAVAVALLRRHLVLQEYLVETATRAEESVAIAQLVQPDLIILDLDIAYRHGIELATEVRNTVCADTPMIATSTVLALLGAASLYGLFQGYCEKPLHMDELIARIEALTRH